MSTDELRQIRHDTIGIKDTLRDDEPTSERKAFLTSLFLDALKYLLQAMQIIMIVPADRATGNLKALLNSEVDTTVRNDDITTF